MSDSVNISQARQQLLGAFPEISGTIGSAIVLFVPVIVIGNGFVLASVLLDPFKNIRSSPFSILIFNLALADFFVGILTAPLMAVWYIYMAINNTELFPLSNAAFSGYAPVGASLYTLIALSVDRQIAITTPLKYKHRVTKRKVRNACICIWIYCISSVLLSMVLENYNARVYTIAGRAHTVTVAVALAVLNILVIRSVRAQASSIKRTVDSENLVVLQNAFNREKAVTRITVTLVVACEVCIIPYVILLAANSYFLKGITDLYVKKILLWVYHLAKVLLFANSLLNPFLYVWRLPKYRKSFKYILNQIKKKLCNCTAQPESKAPRKSFQVRPSVANHRCVVLSPETTEPRCSSVKDIADFEEHLNSNNYQLIENTKL